MEKVDMRIVKTKNSLAVSLIQLLETTNYNDIKISALCQRAHVSRATFYNNFNSIDEVLAYYIQNYQSSIEKRFTLRVKKDNLSFQDAYKALLEIVVDTFSKDTAIINNIIAKNNANQIYDMINSFLNKTIAQLLEKYSNILLSVPKPMVCNYLAGAITGLIFYLLPNSSLYSNQEKVDYIYKLTSSGFYQIH